MKLVGPAQNAGRSDDETAASGRPKAWFRRVSWTLCLVLTLGAVVLHVVNFAAAGPLWRDEAAFVNVSTKPTWSEMANTFPLESFPLGPFVLTRLWAALGPGKTDLGLRLGGLLVGLLMLGALWWTGRLLKTGPPFLSLALLGFAAVFVRWGDAVRGYGLGTLLILLTFGLMWKVLESSHKRYWLAATVAAVLSVQFLYHNSVLLFAIGVAALAVGVRRRTWRGVVRVGLVCAVAALTVLPYLDVIRETQDWRALHQVDLTVGVLWRPLSSALNGPTGFLSWVWVGLGVLLLAAAGLALIRTRRDTDAASRHDAALYAGLTLLVGAVGYVGFLRFLRYLTQVWYYVALMGLAAAAIDVGLNVWAAVARRARVAIMVTACAIATFSWPGTWTALQYRQTNVDRVAAELQRRADADDLIVLDPWFFGITFSRYYRGPTSWETIPPLEDKSIHRWDLFRRRMMASDPIAPVLHRTTTTLQAGHRVWVVGELQFVKEGEPVGYLPPAPNSRYGWSFGPYGAVWSRQLAYRFQTTAPHFSRVPIPGDGPVSPYEHVSLYVFEGVRH